MGRGDVDAGDGAIVTDGKGQLRGRTQLVVELDADTVGSQDAGSQLCELGREVTGIIGDCHAACTGFRTILDDQIGQTLGCRTDRKAVHAIQTNAQYAAQTSRTKGQRSKETILDRILIAADCLQLSALICGQCRRCKPALILSHIIHNPFTS